jgi:hypothetical protein
MVDLDLTYLGDSVVFDLSNWNIDFSPGISGAKAV